MDELEVYHKRCRLCASDHRLGINLFGQEGVALELQSKIKTYLSIEVDPEDELPKQVCYQCLYRIETFHNFKRSCVESEHTLRNWHLFYGGFSELKDECEEEEEEEEDDEESNATSAAESDGSGSSKISVDSVAQPTSSSLTKMAETAQKMMSPTASSSSSSTKKQLSPGGKSGAAAMKNVNQENNEVSRILLNMSGVGTISVTKFEGTREGASEKRQNLEDSVVISDDEEESDGFSGFDFDDTSKEDEAEDVLVGEFVPNECVQFEHLEVDQNGEVTVADGDPLNDTEVKSSDPDDYLRYMMVTMDVPGETRYSCLKCNKTFAQKSYVKEHMKIHTGEKPFKCTECGRGFRNNYMLKVHFRLHTGEKNFKCEECGALFTERGALVSHSRTHSGIKPFACTYCDRRFAQNPALKRHLRIHTKEKPYLCEHCDACFADRGTWRNHMRTHTGERPYDCTLCGKRFVQRTNLQAHIKTHTDERPYPCKVCESSFRTKAHLVKHLSTIHRDVMKSVATYMKIKKYP